MGAKIRRLSAFVAVTACVVAFQNCSAPSDFTGLSSQASSGGTGNGDSYGGKPGDYSYYDPANPCDKGRDNKPLPNQQIRFATSYQLVRENCRDIVPQNLDPAAVSFSSNESLSYRGLSFALTPVRGQFDVMAAECPSGRSPRAGAVRTNLVESGDNLLALPPWIDQWTVASASGVLGSLPAFTIERWAAPSTTYWERYYKSQVFKPSTDYALSFFAAPGTKDEIYFSSTEFENNVQLSSIEVYLDTRTGAGRVAAAMGYSNVSFTSRLIDGTRFFTIYFRSHSYTPVSSAFGFGPGGMDQSNQDVSKPGDSIKIANIQMEEIASFCQ